MYLLVENSEEAKRCLPVYMLTVGADYVQKPVQRTPGIPLYQIFFVDRGSIRFTVNGEEVILGGSTVLFMQKGLPVSYERMTEESRTGWVAFDGEGIEGILSYFRAAPFSYQNDSSVKELRRACIRAVEKKASSEALSALVYELMLAYFRALNQTEESAPLAAAKVFMETNFATDPSIAEVAEAAGISESLLYRLFRREGNTPVGYLRSVRMQNAKRMLLEAPEMSVAEISLACGFSNAAYFCKVFHAAEGMTPKGYRDIYLS